MMRLTYPTGCASSASPSGSIRQRVVLASIALALGSVTFASAATYTVGLGGGCSHATIAAALATAENHPGPDTIRITRSASYTAQQFVFTTSQELTLTGGYANCTTTTEDNTYTTLDGAGDPPATVITIFGNTGSLIRIRKLYITGGDVRSDDWFSGGGIQYKGNGLLDIADSGISQNHGGHGGGIRADGTGSAAALNIGPNTSITLNTANYDGGGIYAGGIKAAIHGANIAISLNEATGVGSEGGFGGGILIRACDLDSSVYLGSPGLASGVVAGNSARYGGGVAIMTAPGCTRAADLRMYSIAADFPTRIAYNSASVSGGGVYMYHAGGPTNVFAHGGSIQNNQAPVASALWLGDGGNAYFNTLPSSFDFGDDFVDCAIGIPCGSISGNISSSGQVISGQANNEIQLARLEITGNEGKELIRLGDLLIRNSLIADNHSTLRLLETHNGYIAGSTIVDNQVGFAEVIGVNTGGTFTMNNAVAWQPGKLILHNDGGVPAIDDNVTNELVSLSGPNSNGGLVANPRLIDPHAGGDYRPTAGSPVIDYHRGGVADRDVLNLRRAIDLPLVENFFGPSDVGAYERQALLPIVENGEFAKNARVWTIPDSAAASYDASQNAPGSSGGSLHVKSLPTSGTVVGAVQCIHLPGPGIYSLNGSGKVASGDQFDPHYAKVYWELRLSGSETCTGIPSATGILTLAGTGSTWHRPTAPASIMVTPQQFTTDTSVALQLWIQTGPGNGRPNGINSPSGAQMLEGWIDHVALSIGSDDTIFTNGFDVP